MIYDRVVSQYLKHKSSREMPQSKNIKSLSTIHMLHHSLTQNQKIGRASCREREKIREMSEAEDGIRDRNVTGVQTCALPISFFYPRCCPLYLLVLLNFLNK